ncbi:MAG: signal peptide peptidase SppA [Bacteroidales bacterium]|nr:signal peptide peptidase SppA [Bacteroidales bacterium]HOY38487.1 signal peptide peptidase SppA [Bacteroidales bacterium]HQP05007.1 signal peptide peptidase SppA [Bacteroidales bacterium]
MKFWKIFLACLLGSFVAMILYVVFMFFSFGVLLSSLSPSAPAIKDNSVLKITLSEDIPDRTNENPFVNFDFATFKTSQVVGLNDILKCLEKAKTDEKIKGIFLDVSSVPAGMATLEEIRNALIEFKETGKFIISYSDAYTQKSYYLASVADKIYLNPQGGLDWRGMYAQVTFFKGTLEKMGIEVQVFRHGKFKSAIEPFLLDKMSEENKLQTLTYVSSIWNHMLTGISVKRNITVADLNLYADSLMIFDAKSALQYKFVDKLVYRDEVLTEIKTKASYSDKDEDYLVSLGTYSKIPVKAKKEKYSENRIAVIFAEGSIVDGDGKDDEIGGDRLAAEIRKAREDEKVKAVVLRVNSPGGSGLASEIILHEMELTKAVKPVVVSMGNYAASGGYYIACKASYIFAQPNTLTGSIGVFGLLPNMQKLLTDKIGLSFDGVGTNAHSDMGSITRPVTTQEGMVIQKQIEDFYSVFINHVAQGRSMTVAEVDSIGQGRVWSGENALQIGLVDEIGGLDKAVKKAVELAKLTDYRIKELPEVKDFFETMMSDFSNQMEQSYIKKNLGEDYRYIEMLQYVKNASGVQARIPYQIDVY